MCVDDGFVVGHGHFKLLVRLDGSGLAGQQLCWQLAVLAVCSMQWYH